MNEKQTSPVVLIIVLIITVALAVGGFILFQKVTSKTDEQKLAEEKKKLEEEKKKLEEEKLKKDTRVVIEKIPTKDIPPVGDSDFVKLQQSIDALVRPAPPRKILEMESQSILDRLNQTNLQVRQLNGVTFK